MYIKPNLSDSGVKIFINNGISCFYYPPLSPLTGGMWGGVGQLKIRSSVKQSLNLGKINLYEVSALCV